MCVCMYVYKGTDTLLLRVKSKDFSIFGNSIHLRELVWRE